MPPKQRKPREWGHPEGLPLEEVDKEALYDGVVTNVSPYGVFVDFGAVKDALLKVKRNIARAYRPGMTIKGLTVITVEPDKGKVVLEPDEATLPEPPPRKRGPRDTRRSRSAGPARRGEGEGEGGERGGEEERGGGGEGGGRRGGASRRAASQPAPRKKVWDHKESGVRPLEELRQGEVCQGIVTNVSPFGVFVDIGAARDARLHVSQKIGKRFSRGDVVEECILENINLETQRLSVILEDAEEVVSHLPPKERKPKAKGKAKGKAKATARQPKGAEKEGPQAKPAVQPQPPAEGCVPIEELVVGSLCDGVVSSRNQYGVFVNIGCEKDAKLKVPKRLMQSFQRGDEVYGMKIETVDIVRNLIAVSLEDPELSVDGEEEELAPPQPPPPAKRPVAAPPAAPAAKRSSPAPPAAPAAKRSSAAPPAAPAAKRSSAAAPAAPEAKSAPSAGAKSGLKAKATPKAKAKLEHPDGLPLSRFPAGTNANGSVMSIGMRGVLVDIGAVMDGLLQLPRHIARQFQVEDEVRGMTVEGPDETGERLLLSLDDPELEEPDEPAPPPPRAAARTSAAATRQEPASKAKATAKTAAASTSGQATKAKSKIPADPEAKPAAVKVKAKSAAKAQAVATKNWEHPGALLIEDLQPGTEVSGVVTNVNHFGVFVNFGAVKDGKLRIPRSIWRSFKSGDEVEGLVIDDVNTEAGSVWLRLATEPEDGEQKGQLEAEEEPTSRPPAARKAQAPKPSAPKRAAAKPGAGAAPSAPAAAGTVKRAAAAR